ncbi:DUF4279 domain-containing protein [Iodobacter sp. HSC-16F04]|uniref:DUF4279 domain-containing protein n=1 Tax=Iodobacter violaceini TaxID=3044271 RepID=A0ABX0KY50_9NEIS|nr:DUF4279 domain-containing protein [Iodobacter violacea]NHQ88716.1 DUF4279 domain-containing protein [Iodobacter violacea]
MKNIVQIDFQLLGTRVLPKEISKKIEIVPDVELMRGERNKERDLPRQNIWSIRSQENSDDVADHWHNLEGILNNSREIIKEIAETGSARLTIIINSHHRVPSIIIPSSMSEFAGFINAEIDIDHLQS